MGSYPNTGFQNAIKLNVYLAFHFFLMTSILSFLLNLIGCSPEIISVTLSNKPLISNPDSVIFIKSVIDNRGTDPYIIGNISGAVTGDKITIALDDSLSVYIKKYFNSFVENDHTCHTDIIINSFSLAENFSRKDIYHLFGSFNFIYENDKGRDTTITLDINTNISRDKVKLVEEINTVLAGCLNQGQHTLNNIKQKEDLNVKPKMQSAGSFPIINLKDTTKQREKRTTNQIVYDEQVPLPELNSSNVLKGLGFTYFTGDKITGGVQFDFRLGYQKPDWEYGYSIGFLYITIKNFPYEGYLWGFNVPFHGKYMLSDSYLSPYIGGTLRFIGGRTDNKTKGQQDTFWGPIFEEYFGLALNRSVFIEAGVFQMYLFNSPLLPGDGGFKFSFHFLVGR